MPDYFSLDFSGRAPRRTFWLNHLAALGVIAFVSALVLVAFLAKSTALSILIGVVAVSAWVCMCVSGWATGTRRCRDLGHSGWVVLLYLVPLVNTAFFLYLRFAPSRNAS